MQHCSTCNFPPCLRDPHFEALRRNPSVLKSSIKLILFPATGSYVYKSLAPTVHVQLKSLESRMINAVNSSTAPGYNNGCVMLFRRGAESSGTLDGEENIVLMLFCSLAHPFSVCLFVSVCPSLSRSNPTMVLQDPVGIKTS